MPYPGVPSHLTQKMERCVSKVMATGKDKSSAIAICHGQIMGKKESKDGMVVAENIKFNWQPEFEIQESQKGKQGWLCMGGTALVECVSENKNHYTLKNLEENDGKQFKWLFGHPNDPEEHVIGLGSLKLENGVLKHEGRVRNTARHPDVVEAISDGFLGPSIHASAKKVVQKNNEYFIEGLSIDGIGTVAFQGVKRASIDYAIAESIKKRTESDESADANNNDKKGDAIMAEEEIKQPEEQPVEQPAEQPSEEPVEEEESAVKNQIKEMKEQIELLKLDKKKALVESIMAINPKQDAEKLMKESEDRLMLVKEYEAKLKQSSKGAAVVIENAEESGDELVEKGGDITMSAKMYERFNKELRERVR